MQKKSGGMIIRLTPEAFNYFANNKPEGVGVAGYMAEVLETFYKQNFLKKGEQHAGNIQEIPERPV